VDLGIGSSYAYFIRTPADHSYGLVSITTVMFFYIHCRNSRVYSYYIDRWSWGEWKEVMAGIATVVISLVAP